MNKKVLKRKLNFLKQPAENYFFKENHRRTMQYAKYYEGLKIKKNTILYESRDGNSITDSPYAMFKFMLKDEKFQDYLHIWSIQDFDALSSVISNYKDMPNVKFVRRNSNDYLKCLASCEYLINNSTFQSFFIPKSEQTYINTWHGTPLKHMGFDIPGNPANSQNVVRNFIGTDYILSPNAHTTKIFTESYKLNGLYEGTVIEEGYPRIDLTLNTNLEEFSDYLRDLGLTVNKSKETILYAPTWKGTNISKVNNDVLQIIADFQYLETQIGDKYNLLVKVHPYLYKEALNHPEIKSQLVPDFVDPNELLAVVDMLVTDYSSIFFDYLVTNKPILFYTWDSDAYSEERGQYLKNEDLPGPMLFNCKELADAIRDIEAVKVTYFKKYKIAQEKYTNYEDGKVTDRIVRYIFKETTKELNTITCLFPQKEKILIYPGGMRDNGITSSFINLMNNIDFDKYDVSCFTGTPSSKEVIKNINKVNKNVRFLFKLGLPAYKVTEVYRDKLINNRGESGTIGKKLYPEDAYVREQARLFGKTKFDYAIDFSGYSLYWAKFLLSSTAKKKICFMHNDLLSDSERMINGKRLHRVNLRGLFSVYNRFDKLVSVSKGTMELNRKNLLQYADYDQFDYVMNSINPEKILQVESYDDVEELKISDEKSFPIENYKARAILKDIQNYSVWNTLPVNINAVQFQLGNRFENAEIIISRKVITEETTLYKFSFNNQMIGWINAEAVKLLPDSIIDVKMINKIAKLSKPKGNHIWSKPYKLKGIQKISGSLAYQNIVVDVDMETTTEHSTYSRISIHQTLIGWIDNNALNFLEECTINKGMSIIEKQRIVIKRKSVKGRNYSKHKGFISNIENRTLIEKNINIDMFAIIAKPEKHLIWTKAYPNFKVKKVAKAIEFAGQVAKIVTIHKTRKGIYYQFSIDNKKIGWLDSKAFEVINNSSVNLEKADAKIKLIIRKITLNNPYHNVKFPLENTLITDSNVDEFEKNGITKMRKSIHTSPLETLQSGVLKKNEIFGVTEGIFDLEPNPDNINFVNMGRLSPEKGQDNLIRAFTAFHKENKNSKLYILGQGPLKDDLQSLINELEMESSVHLLGQLESPFPFMGKCDCFVLSSHYEGQPMVLLEAMTLGMKIMATDIVANRTVLEDGKFGLLVENSVDGLVQGFRSIANKENIDIIEKFDYNQYNLKAMETFYNCIK